MAIQVRKTLLCALLLIVCATAYIQESQNQLYEYLFLSRKGTNWLRTFPICDNIRQLTNITLEDYIASRNTSLLQVGFVVYFNRVTHLNEKEQSVTAKFTFVLKWTDCRLTWNTKDFAGIRMLVVNTNDVEVFIPKLSLEERLGDDINWAHSSLAIKSDGSLTLQKTVTILLGCEMDVGMYPFDSQSCKATFRSRTYALKKLNVTVINTGVEEEIGHADSYVPSDTWSLVESYCDSDSYSMDVDAETGGKDKQEMHLIVNSTGLSHVNKIRKEFAQVKLYFTLQRQPFYEVANLLLPAVMTVIISACVFFVPPGASDKVEVSLTILLGMFVFTQIMYDKMPQRGSQLPLLSAYFLVCLFMICCSCLVAMFTTNLSERQDMCMNPLIHRIFLKWIGPKIRPELFRTVGQRRSHRDKLHRWLSIRTNGNEAPSEGGVCNRAMKNEHPAVEMSESAGGSGESKDEESASLSLKNKMNNQWMKLAQVCDRLFLLFHLSVTMILFILFASAGIMHIYGNPAGV